MSSRTALRRCIGWVLATVYSTTALGLPLPHLQATTVGEAAYPCQGKRCGCRTAEQCWKTCCCHSATERVAWARERGIRVPQELVAWAANETAATPVRNCCSAKRSCCDSRSPVAARSASLRRDAAAKNVAPAKRPFGITWVSPLDARGCRGETPMWNSVPISLPAVALKPLACFEPCVQPLRLAAAVEPYCPCFSPADPPPRGV